MKQSHFLGFILILFLLFNLINCAEKQTKWKRKNRYNKTKLNSMKRKNSKRNINKFLRRNQDGEEPIGRFNTTFMPLNIYLDLNNFNHEFPSDIFGAETKNIFIQAMNRAKEILEGYLYIEIDYDFKIILVEDYLESHYNILYYNESIKTSKLIPYNLFILFDFTDYNEDDSSFDVAIEDAGAPIIGIVSIDKNLGVNQLKLNYLTNFMLKQFIYILGFNPFALNQKDLIETQGDTFFKEEKFPNLINYAKKYFDCSTITGIDIETEPVFGNMVWPSRLLLGEIMTDSNYPEEQILSGFTINFLKDLPYLQVKKDYNGGLMRFGKNKGCKFIEEDCSTDFENKNKIFANEFNLPTTLDLLPETPEPSCSSGRLSKTVHMYHEETPSYPRPDIIESCPISEYNGMNSEDIYIGHCNQENSVVSDSNLQNIINEYFSSQSFCVLSSLVSTEHIAYIKIRSVCYEMFCSSKSLTIRINNNYLVCPRSGGKITADNLGLEGYLLCPDYNLICTGKTVCNSNYDCFSKKSEEKEESFNYDYDIKTTQNIEKSNSAEADNTTNYELSEDGQCPQFCRRCKKTKNKYMECQECKEGYGLKLETDSSIKCYDEDEFKEGYYKNENNVYIKCIENCDKCRDLKTCVKCKENYRYFSSQCVFIPEEDRNKIIPYCLQTDKDYNCLSCEDGYAFKENNYSKCYNIENELTDYYRKDNKSTSFLPCSKQIDDCNQCYYDKKEYRVKCTHCIDGLVLLMKGKGTCQLKEEIENNTKYYLVNETHASVCSKDIENCISCTSEYNCIQCKYTYIYNNYENKCVSKYQTTKNDDEVDLSDTSTNILIKQATSSESPSKSTKRRTVKKKANGNSSNYFSISNIILLQTIYIIFILINF